MIIERIFSRINSLYHQLYGNLRFKTMGKNVRILRPLNIQGYSNIEIGDNVLIQYKTWLAAVPLTGFENALLKIGSGSIIGNFNHIYATRSIIIGNNVLTADKVYISDNLHNYQDIHVPIMHQGINQNNVVSIGDGCWIGENACILGAEIGKNCVIGSNAVVTKNIPDFCVAVGAPAKIIKRFCLETQTWKKTNGSGDFI